MLNHDPGRRCLGGWRHTAGSGSQTDETANGMSHYTMAARSDSSLDSYFSQLEAGFSDRARIC